MAPLFSSSIKVNCPDGPRYILKNPEKAFAIAFPDWDVRINALVKFFTGSEVKMDPKIFKRTKAIVKNLTENYANLQAHYQAAYLGWWGNPCSKEAEKAFNEATARICQKDFGIRKLESATSEIAKEIEAKRKRELERTDKYESKWTKAKPRYKRRYTRKTRIPIPETAFEKIEALVSELKL
jgi:hypothetical protein